MRIYDTSVVLNFIYAIVTIVYALACLTNESDQGKYSISKSSEDRLKKEDAKGFPVKLMEILRKKVGY
jgi:hypothetical protein